MILLFITAAFSCKKDALQSFADGDGYMQDDLHAPSGIATKKANTFNALFTRYGNGWTGGDATYSVYLPDGRTVWMFGDTFLDTVYPDRSRPVSGLIRNSFVVQNGTAMTTLFSGTEASPHSLVDTDDPSEWYWPGDATVQNDTLFVYFGLFHTTGTGGFDFKYKRTDRVAFSLPGLNEISRTTVWNHPNIMYGTTVYEDTDYTYIFGTEWSTPLKYAHVERVPAGNLHAAPEFWNGGAWVTETPLGSAGRLVKSDGSSVDVSAQFAIFYFQGKYRLLTQESFLGAQIFSYESNSPVGPWTHRKKVYTTPETGGNIWTYNAWVHPEFVNADGYMLMSYNINSMNFADLFTNADNYRPKFIWFRF